MSNLSVVARSGRWMLVDDDDAELGAYRSQAEALAAAGRFTLVDYEPRHVLIHDPDEDWAEELVEPPELH